MKKVILIFMAISTATLSNAQAVKGELEGRQTLVMGNNLVVTGHTMRGNKATFKATSYNKDLKIIEEYEKEIPKESQLKWCASTKYGNILVVCIQTKTKNIYWLKLTDELKEISFFEETDSNVKDDLVDESHKKLFPYQRDIEGSVMGLAIDAEGDLIKNDRFLNNDIIDFDRESKTISRNKLIESKQAPCYFPVWKTKLENINKIKLVQFSSVDEDIIIGRFIVKEKKKWNNYICRLDSKTGELIFMIPVPSLSEDNSFFISNSYFDKQNDNLVVAGKLCSSGGEKCNEMAILLFDKSGNQLKSKKINLPEYDFKEPGGFNFKNKSISIECIGKLDNGNYFFNIANRTRVNSSGVVNAGSSNPQIVSGAFQLIVGFSYYEIDDKLNVINSNFKIAENFDKKNSLGGPTVLYNGASKDGKYLFFIETIKKSKSLRMMDMFSKESKTKELKYIDEFTLGIAFTTDYDMDFLEVYFLDNNLITFQKFHKSNNYEISTIQIK